jgi:hypothetical protein
VISSTQRPLSDNKQHSKETDIYATAGIRTRNSSKQAAADPHRNFDIMLCYVMLCYVDTNPRITLNQKVRLSLLRLERMNPFF